MNFPVRFYKISRLFRYGFLLFLILFIPAFYAGENPAALLFFRFGMLLLTGLWATEIVFFRNSGVSNFCSIKRPLIFFSLFAGTIFFQGFFYSVQPHQTRLETLNLFFYFLFFLCALDSFSSRERIHLAFLLVAIESVFLIGFGFYQQAHHFHSVYAARGALQYGVPFFSSFLNQNHYGFFLLLVTFFLMPCIAYTYEKSDSKLRSDQDLFESVFYLLLIPAAAASSFYVEARAAFVGQIAGFILFWIFSLSPEYRKKAFWTALVLTATSFLFIYLFYSERLHEAYQRLPESLQSRFKIYQNIWHLFKDHAFWGTGFGTFGWISQKYQMLDVENSHWTHAWNDHLELLCETGLIGYLLFLAAMASLVLPAAAECFKSRSRWARLVGIGSLMAIIWIFLFSFFDYYLKTPAVALLAILHLVFLARCARLYSEHSGPAPSEISSMFRRSSVKVFLWAAYLVFCLVLLGVSLADYQFEKIIAKTNPTIAELKEATRLEPDNPQGWGRLGDVYYSQAIQSSGEDYLSAVKESIFCFEKAAGLAPTWPNYRFSLGRAKVLANQTTEGMSEMETGLQAAPGNRDLRLYIILSFLKLADHTSDSKNRALYESKAVKYLQESSILPRPLSSEDFIYLKNGSHLLVQEKARLTALFHKIQAQQKQPESKLQFDN